MFFNMSYASNYSYVRIVVVSAKLYIEDVVDSIDYTKKPFSRVHYVCFTIKQLYFDCDIR